MWTIDEVNQKLKTQNDSKRENFDKYMALADHHIEWVELPYRGKSLPAIFHLPPNYQTRHQGAGDRRGVRHGRIQGALGLRSTRMRWMERGYAVLAFEGPGYWEPPLRGIYVDVPGWAEAAQDRRRLAEQTARRSTPARSA